MNGNFPSISTYIWVINLVLTGPCGLPAIHSIIIYSVAVIPWVFAISFCPIILTSSPKAFPALLFCSDPLWVLKFLGHLVQVIYWIIKL